TASGFRGALQRGVDAMVDEVECGAAVHGDRWPGIVREHEYGGVARGISAPPPLPVVIRPGPPDWPKHMSADDPRSDVGESPRRKVVIDSHGAAVTSEHLLKGSRGANPLVQCATSHS